MLVEIEACINSQSLVLAGDDAEELTLTPSHFLLGKTPFTSVPLRDVPAGSVVGGELRALHEAQERLMEVFWHAWSTHYLRNLPQLCRSSAVMCALVLW